MGNCTELITMLSDYIDGELDKDLCKDLEAHLNGCNNCKLMFNSMKMTVQLCRDGSCEDLPQDLQDRFQAKLRERWQEKFGKLK